jgi:hypothetical protein
LGDCGGGSAGRPGEEVLEEIGVGVVLREDPDWLGLGGG